MTTGRLAVTIGLVVTLCATTTVAVRADDRDAAPPRVTLDSGTDGERVGSALLGLRGRVRNHEAGPYRLTVRSPTSVGVLGVDDRGDFDLPVYVWADAGGTPVELELRAANGRGTGEVLATTDVELPDFDLSTVEARLDALDTALAAGLSETVGNGDPLDQAVHAGLELADDLLDAGHPVLASVALARVEDAVPPLPERLDPARRAEIITSRVQLDIVLGHGDAVDAQLGALRRAGLDEDVGAHRRTMVTATTRLYRSASLALVRGMPTALAEQIQAAANDLQARLGRLPRRLPRGY